MTDTFEVRIDRVANGGDGIGRDPSGRTVFVEGALLGETVTATVLEQRKQWSRAIVDEVLVAAPGRRTPPCPHVAEGCGGCDMQHATPEAQLDMRVAVVADVLRRQARLEAWPEIERRILPAEAYRTTVRVAIDPATGTVGYRRRGSHDVVSADGCLIAHPALQELIDSVQGAEATELPPRLGARTGERLVLAEPSVAGLEMPDDVRVVGADELAAGKRAWYHEEVAGRRWRISAESFFQNRPDGAEALVEVVGEMLADVAPGSHLVDLYAGVGLFAGTVGATHRVTAVEMSPSAVADARINLADTGAKVVGADVASWTPRPADAVVADPSRDGLGAAAVGVIAGTGAGDVVLVGCDAAAFGRDVGLLVARGYGLQRVVVVDMFPQTSHIEVVAHLTR